MQIPHISGQLSQGCTSTGERGVSSSAVWTSQGSPCGYYSLCRMPLPVRIAVIQVGRVHWRLSGPTSPQGLKLDTTAKLDYVAQGPGLWISSGMEMEWGCSTTTAKAHWWLLNNMDNKTLSAELLSVPLVSACSIAWASPLSVAGLHIFLFKRHPLL